MADNIYQNIVVVGAGTIAYDVLRYCHETVNNCTLAYIEYAAYPFNAATVYANSKGIPFIFAKEKHTLHDYVNSLDKKTLVISANNTYIFPKDLVEKPNLTIINFHNALLPHYPGLNAASWVIYNHETLTGVTWHYVSADLDAGEIITQKQVALSEDVTAGELAGILMKLGTSAFREILAGILNGTIRSHPQEKVQKRRLFRASEIPGNGVFSLDDKTENIYRLLRSMDYGPIRIFSAPCTQYQGNNITITEYKLIKQGDTDPLENHLYLPYRQNLILCLKYKQEANKQNHAI